MQIVQGKVSYTRTVRPADFESKSATVELTFSVEDGAPDAQVREFLDTIGSQAQAKAQEMVGEKAPARSTQPRQDKPAAKEPTKAAEVTVPVADKAPTKTKADLEKEALAAAGSSATTVDAALNIQATPEDRKDPADVEDLMSPVETKQVTDEELLDAVTKTNARIKNSVAIRELIGRYVAKPKVARDMTQEQRTAFLIELGKL